MAKPLDEKQVRAMFAAKDAAAHPRPDPRDPDYSRPGMFAYHNCSHCHDGAQPCVKGNPRQCEYPHARND